MIAKEIITLEDNKIILLEALNGRQVKLTTTSDNIILHKDKNRLIRLFIQDRMIWDNDLFTCVDSDENIGKIPFRITESFDSFYNIKHAYTTGIPTMFLLETNKFHICNYFLPPLITGISYKDELSWNYYFTNSYFVEDLPQIAISVRFFPTDSFYNLEKKLQNLSTYITSYSWSEQHILFIFQVLPEQMYEFEVIKRSKYSQLTSKFKERLLKFYDFSKDSDMAKVLYKDIKRKKQLELEFNVEYISVDVELFESINLKEETISIIGKGINI